MNKNTIYMMRFNQVQSELSKIFVWTDILSNVNHINKSKWNKTICWNLHIGHFKSGRYDKVIFRRDLFTFYDDKIFSDF